MPSSEYSGAEPPLPMWAEAGLVLAAHGTDTEPVRAHAEAIAARRLFARVAFGLLRGAPSLEDAVAALGECPLIYIVPFFMADGHFVREVIPRRLGLTGSLTRSGNMEIAYCAPVGA
ncbi:MAG: CbiX/SirB N-terminal domain-containing protein, partial [Alphaproteobacteria bacterium]